MNVIIEPIYGNAEHYQETYDPSYTPAQLYGVEGSLADNQLYQMWAKYYSEYIAMRTDPTIAFGRMLCIAPLVIAGWAYNETDEAPSGAKEFITKQLEKHRINVMKTAMEGYIDFGWQPYEVVKTSGDDGSIVLDKVKPLLQQYTTILVNRQNGSYIGLRQEFSMYYQQINLIGDESLVLAIDVEGTDWYGRPLLENVRDVDTMWGTVNDAADRYDQKVSGAHWVVYYPIGTTPYKGSDTDNFEIAKDILNSMESSSKLAVPQEILKFMSDTNDNVGEKLDAWKIELITAESKESSFIDRQKYLDVLKIRGMGLPERAVLEGQFGTKAEAGAHADFAIVNFEMRHVILCDQLNKRLIYPLMQDNYGKKARESVYITPIPLIEKDVQFLRQLYTGFLSVPEVSDAELANVDFDVLRERLDVPTKEQESNTIMDQLRRLTGNQNV